MSKLSPKDIEALARDATADTGEHTRVLELHGHETSDTPDDHHPSPLLAAGLGLFEPVCAAIWLGKASWAFGFAGVTLGLVAFSASPWIESKGAWLASLAVLLGFRFVAAGWAWQAAKHAPAVPTGRKWGRGWATVAAVWLAMMGITVFSEATAGKVAPMPVPAALDVPGEAGPGIARIHPIGQLGAVTPGEVVLWVDGMYAQHISRVIATREHDVHVQLSTGGTAHVQKTRLYGRVLFRLK